MMDSDNCGLSQALVSLSLHTPEQIAAELFSLRIDEKSKSNLLKSVEAIRTYLSPPTPLTSGRYASMERSTKETQISVSLDIDGGGQNIQINTGIGFYDHMLHALAKHGHFDITLQCTGDLHIDDHHTVEDCALALGQAFDKAMGERKGIARYGSAHAPLDEALSMAVVDISSRPFALIDLTLQREKVGSLSTEMLSHALHSFAMAARITLHVRNITGSNDHHKAESAFKALALALRQALTLDEKRKDQVPSTKGVLA